MSGQELILNVKELHVLSLTCAHCGHGTIFDFRSSDYLEKSVSAQCAICKTELAVDLQEQLKAYRCFYDSMSKCDRLEFRVRLNNPDAAASAAASESASEGQGGRLYSYSRSPRCGGYSPSQGTWDGEFGGRTLPRLRR